MTLAFTASESNYHYVTSAAISSDPAKPNWRKSATKLVDKIIIKCCAHAGSKTSEQFSVIHFHIFIAKLCFVLPIA